MQILDINNPFVSFLSSCGKKDLLEHVPAHTRDSIYGQCRHLDIYWRELDKAHKSLKTIIVISLDGIGSKELFNLWKDNKYSCKPIIPEYVKDFAEPVILFDNSAEGFSDEYMFSFISQVVNHYNLNPDNTYYCNSSINIQDIQQQLGYNNFQTFCANNFMEDSMAELYEIIEYDFKEDNQLVDIDTDLHRPSVFSCLNNAPKHHRTLLLGCMSKLDLLQDGYVSSSDLEYNKLYSKTITQLSEDLTNLIIEKEDFEIAVEWLDKLKPHYPIVADKRTEDSIHMKEFGDDSFIQNMLNCDVQVITETFSNNNLFVSEKVFKPIVMCQPFIILGSNKTYKHLQELGYNTFDYLIDTHKLDTTMNNISKIIMVCDAIQQLKEIKSNPIEWKNLQDKISIDVIHNYNLFVSNLNTIKENSALGLHKFFDIRPGYKLPLRNKEDK